MASQYRHHHDLHNPDGPTEARRFGWIYEYQGRMALTGAGAYHAGEVSGGMLGR